jgi:hypothetical protein
MQYVHFHFDTVLSVHRTNSPGCSVGFSAFYDEAKPIFRYLLALIDDDRIYLCVPSITIYSYLSNLLRYDN